MRTFLIAGNWKMNAGATEAKTLADEMVQTRGNQSSVAEALICPPFVSIPFVAKSFRDSDFQVGAQNVSTEDNGAYTGEISTGMLKELNCKYIILGHSERREYFHEDDELVARKTRRVLGENMKAIVCVGEKLEDRKNDNHENIVKGQVEKILNAISSDDSDKLVIAYEPVWAIGTGETATPEQAQEMHLLIRSLIEEQWGSEVSDDVRILYGGSMKPANAKELLSQPDVDGGLIGGASLKSESFIEILNIAESIDR